MRAAGQGLVEGAPTLTPQGVLRGRCDRGQCALGALQVQILPGPGPGAGTGGAGLMSAHRTDGGAKKPPAT